MVTSLQTADVIRYQKEIRRFPSLQPEEEVTLAKLWREYADKKAVHTLLTSHLRLVVKVSPLRPARQPRDAARGCKHDVGRRSSQFAASSSVGRLQKWRADWKYSQTLSR
jgi:sigma-70-like protein